MLDTWDLKEQKRVFSSKPFQVLEKHYNKPNGLGNFTGYVLNLPDWANIIGITPDNKILLIRQYRFGSDKIELEIPGGCIDKGEDPQIGAGRELEEETGYKAESLIQIGVVDANPAIQNNRCYSYLAKNIRPTGKINFDPDEMIEHEFATLEQVHEYIRDGKMTNTYMIAAFYWLAQHQDKI